MRTRINQVVFGAALLGLALPGPVAQAQGVPDQINFTGRLLDDGAPITGTRDLEFRLYTTPSSATEIWSEVHPQVQVNAGFFAVVLGDVNPIDYVNLFDGNPLYLETIVDGNALSPRLETLSVTYAFRAGTCSEADTLGGLVVTDLQQRVVGNCTVGSFITAINPDGTVACDSYTAGAGLTVTGNQLDLDTAVVQSRVTGTCGAGSFMTGVNPDGSVVCAPDANTTYSATVGGGLALVGSSFGLDGTGCNPGDVKKWDGTSWTCQPDAQLDEAAVDAFVANNGYLDTNTGGTVNGNVTVAGNLTVNGTFTGGNGVAISMTKMLFTRNGTAINFTAADGNVYTLDVLNPAVAQGNTHIYYDPGAGADAWLLFNIEPAGSIACTLLHNEDDTPVATYYYATDGGNTAINQTAWGNATTSTFMFRRQGVTGALPMANFASFGIICF